MSETTEVFRLQLCTVTKENGYGVNPGTLKRARFREPGLEITLMQTQVENEGQSKEFWDKKTHILGLKRCEGSGTCDLRPENGILNAAATPTSSWLSDLLEVFFGGAHSAAGTTVLSASGATAFTVQSGKGANFNVGSAFGIVHGGVKYFRRVKAVSGDVITPWPELPFTASANDVVHLGYSNWLSETVSQSLVVTGANVQNVADQVKMNCVIVKEITITVERDKTVSMAVKLEGRPWTGPSAQTLDLTTITEVLVNPIHGGAAKFYVQAIDETTNVNKPLISATFKINGNVRHIEEFSGANEQTNGIVRVGSNAAGVITCRCRFDPQIESWYASQTLLSFFGEVPYLDSDDGVDTRADIFDGPTCFIGAKPKVINEGDLRVHEFELHLMRNQISTSATAGTGRSPFVMTRI